MFASSDTLDIAVPEITVNEPKPSRLEAKILRFPSAVASDAGLLDRLLATMIEFAAQSSPVGNFTAWIKQEKSVSSADRQVLQETYQVMCGLQSEGRNHIWGYIARNLARPVWLSSDSQKADVVIGNPPWVSYRFMSDEFKRRFRTECRAARLWVGGKVATQQDLSSYFYMRMVLLYMRHNGSVALVMPHAALSRQAYENFRKGNVVLAGYSEFWLRFTKAWTFGAKVQPLFPVPSCVLFATRHDSAHRAPLPETVSAFSGTLPRRDSNSTEANTHLIEVEKPWPALATDGGGSPYRRSFRQGATLVPRRLVFVEPVPQIGALPPNPEIPLVRGKVGSQDKKPWREIEPPRGTIEKVFLRPVLLGQSIAPFRMLRALLAIIPWDKKRRKLIGAESAAELGYSRLANWLKETAAIWDAHKRSDLSLLKQYDYYGKLSCQFPVSPIRVVYSASGSNPAACVIRDRSAIVEHKLYWAAAESREEARYLCGILNSEALRLRLEQYQSQGQWGARDIDKYVFNLPIPRFNKDDPLHRRLVDASKAAEFVALGVAIEAADDFRRVRMRVRDELRSRGTTAELDELVEELVDEA